MTSIGFVEFFRGDYPLLVAFLRKTGFTREEAEDAAIEAMLKLSKRWSDNENIPIDNPQGWVRTVAYRIACNQAQRAQKASILTMAGRVDPVHTDPDTTEAEEKHGLLLRLLDKLPTKQRLVLAWHLEGLSDEEISEHLKMKPATVRSNLRHARASLKKAYEAESRGAGNTSSDTGEE